jgi:uncharacterized RDD family membrane protein YckC
MAQHKKGMISLPVIVFLVVGFIAFVTCFAPLISSTITSAPESDPNALGLLPLIVPAVFAMFIIVAFMWATGRKPPGAWGGD